MTYNNQLLYKALVEDTFTTMSDLKAKCLSPRIAFMTSIVQFFQRKWKNDIKETLSIIQTLKSLDRIFSGALINIRN
jgi:hypothetical protein